jgi:hypothetical protein
MTDPTSRRKADHLELCLRGDVGFRRKTTLLEAVELLHDPVPELGRESIDTSTLLLGKRLRAPLVIAAMTGGIGRAGEINRELARVAEERGYGFGLGSQRAMLEPGREESFLVRAIAPSCLLLGNLGGVQARDLESAAVAELAARAGVDAMCIHLNPAMELVQPQGDRSFVGVVAALQRLAAELPVPVVAKETGCGFGWPRAPSKSWARRCGIGACPPQQPWPTPRGSRRRSTPSSPRAGSAAASTSHAPSPSAPMLRASRCRCCEPSTPAGGKPCSIGSIASRPSCAR